MKVKYRVLLLLLCFVLLLSFCLSACVKEPELPETPALSEDETSPTVETSGGNEDNYRAVYDALVKWEIQYYPVPVQYLEKTHSDWLDFILLIDRTEEDEQKAYSDWTGSEMYPPETLNVQYANIESLFPIEPGDQILICEPRFTSNLVASPSVYAFLESRDNSEQELLIQLEEVVWKKQTDVATRDATIADAAAQGLPGTQVVEKVGFVSFQGTATELLALVEQYGKSVFAMFAEEFDDTFGATVAQAQALVDSGHFDVWCKPTQTSPLYGMKPAEIAVYLAQQEE